MDITSQELPVHHILVIGFHHKKGCQIDFCHPPLPCQLESSPWRYLPTLAMPDGAHNYDKDTVYFHLPSLTGDRTIFGVACYQQISTESLKERTEEMTRSTVQKSVCVLSRLPLFGHIQVKLTLITSAYFREGDFSKTSILIEAYENLNSCLSAPMLYTPEAFVGLSPRDLLCRFGSQTLPLFKALLLERRICFFGNNVGEVSAFLLTLVSLLPGTIESGLDRSAVAMTLTEDMLDNRSAIEEIIGAGSSTPPVEYQVPDFLTAVSLSNEEVGFPLPIFNQTPVYPYVSLHFMDSLRNHPSMVIGATNFLFKPLGDITVETDNGSISIPAANPDLKTLLSPTLEDLRFQDQLLSRVRGQWADGTKGQNDDGFFDGVAYEGGDEWIRLQFRYYLVSLLRACLHGDCPCFGSEYLRAVRRTKWWRKYQKSYLEERTDDPGVALIPIGHPGLSDGANLLTNVRVKWENTMATSEGGKKLSKAVQSGAKAVGGALQNAKGVFSSFFSNAGEGGNNSLK